MNNLRACAVATERVPLGAVAELAIRSSMGPFQRVSQRIVYPAVVLQALAELLVEYNQAFAPLVEANREWPTDYQYCVNPDDSPNNFAVQIDMLGLSQAFLDRAASMSLAEVREVLRGVIFEIENSLAMYQLLEQICRPSNGDSLFKTGFRAVLADLRRRFGMPIALLAVTQQKYDAMLETEFGKERGDTLPDAEVQDLSGFDAFFGPDEFKAHLAENDGECLYLLYVRSSDPVGKLRKPNVIVEHPLLSDPDIRRIIKANTLTMNVDDPEMEQARRINDTKGYMAPMNMAFVINSAAELYSAEFLAYLDGGGSYLEFDGQRLSPGFVRYLRAHAVDPEKVASGELALRAKPLKGTYGCYGHLTGPLTNKKTRNELRGNMRKRGSYVIQPEMQTPEVENVDCGTTYTYIDRNFMAIVNGEPVFLGGFRSMMPVNSHEARKKRIHGNGSTVWAEITP